MSLYEDLGVTRTATPDEIRQAHKALARLLHPDRIQDEYTRGVAETTLKRINAAFAVLSDPIHREAYDRELTAPRLAKAAFPSWLRHKWLWAGATAAGLLLIYSVHGPGQSEPRIASAPMPTTSAAAPPVNPERRKLAPQPSPQVERPAPQRQTKSHPPPIEPPRARVRHTALIPPPEIHRPEPALLPPPPEFPSPSEPTLPAVPKPTLDGLWVYLRPAQRNRNANTYPPEFIELTLREANGVLRGRYAARYQVADRPISPEVKFQFEGDAAAGNPATFEWSGNGGSRGEVRLNKVGDQQLQVLWFTTQPGPEMGLSSGSATLIRRQAP